MVGSARFALLFFVSFFLCFVCGCREESARNEVENRVGASDSLGVVWTSADRNVAEKVCFMYVHNAKRAGWFDEVEMIVWGPSAKLLAEDEALQDKVKKMIHDGVRVTACKACSDSYGVSDGLQLLGIEVKYMGVPLADMLKNGWKVLTF